MADKTKILIVDDQVGICETLGDILETEGCIVDKATSGEEAIELVKKRSHNILFLNMKLPGLNGLETYLALKKVNPNIAAVMMTAYRHKMNSLIKEALKQGAYACLYKPFDPKEAVDIAEKIAKKRT